MKKYFKMNKNITDKSPTSNIIDLFNVGTKKAKVTASAMERSNQAKTATGFDNKESFF